MAKQDDLRESRQNLATGGDEYSDSQSPLLSKDTSQLIEHNANNFEAKFEEMDSFITPAEQFFVRSNGGNQVVDVQNYKLEVGGDAIDTPLTLTLEDLMAMPRRTVFSYLECAGNQRIFFDKLLGQPTPGTQWGRGAVGMAAWTGTALAEVLHHAGVRDTAVSVQLTGLDRNAPEGGFCRPLPIAKAMDPDTLLAYRMNDSPLLPEHGFPLRAIVPGWVGSSSIKWLGRIEVLSTPIWSRNNTRYYVLIGDAYPPEGKAHGKIATRQSIKSALALPWPAQLSLGQHLIHAMRIHPTGQSKMYDGVWMAGRHGENPHCSHHGCPTHGRDSRLPGTLQSDSILL